MYFTEDQVITTAATIQELRDALMPPHGDQPKEPRPWATRPPEVQERWITPTRVALAKLAGDMTDWYVAIVNMGEAGTHVAGIARSEPEAIAIFAAQWPSYEDDGSDSYEAHTAEHPWYPFHAPSGQGGSTLIARQSIADDEPWYHEIHRYDGPVPS